MTQLLGMLDENTYAECITERFRRGTKDNEWVVELSDDPRWIVITSDRGKGGNKGGKLNLHDPPGASSRYSSSVMAPFAELQW